MGRTKTPYNPRKEPTDIKSKRGCKHPKAKGSAYERNVCKRLSLWVSDFKRTDIFWRSASSGGRFTQTRKRNFREGQKGRRHGLTGLNDDAHAGDICLTHPAGKLLIRSFVIECKAYKDLQAEQLIFNTAAKPQFLHFWNQAKEQCTRGREPLLIAKENHQQELVCTTKRGLRLLQWAGDVRVTAYFPVHQMYVCLFRDVLALPYSKVAEALR